MDFSTNNRLYRATRENKETVRNFVSQHYGVVLGVVFDMENQKKTIHERWKVLQLVKKRD